MLDELLEKKLKHLEDEDVLVVMDDGLAFLGELDDFDKNTIVLKKVYQAPAKEIDWKQISTDSKDVRKNMEKEEEVGFIDWTKVNLKEVYIRIDHVTRIWRWFKKEREEKTREGISEARRAVYTRSEKLPEERGASMGDIQDTFSG